MRTIVKRTPPDLLTEWRAQRLSSNRGPGMAATYSEMRRDPEVLGAVEVSLVSEQGGLCAYTGHRISMSDRPGAPSANFHIEHIVPQSRAPGPETTDYKNLLACWPAPNQKGDVPYGAVKKDDWPDPARQGDFVSPLRSDCTTRFTFTRLGRIKPARGDDGAAVETITRLRLDHDTLTDLRREAIRGALAPRGKQIRLDDARKLLSEMQRENEALNRGAATTLMPFAFAILPVLSQEIRKLEGIMRRR